MFDKVSQAAEKLATNVSRRAFLGRLGQGALGLAAVIAGVVALPSQAQAGQQYCVIVIKGYGNITGLSFYYNPVNGACPCGGTLFDNKGSHPMTCSK